MLSFILRRLLIAIPILFGLLTVNFFLIRLAPGDPADLYIDKDMDAEVKANIMKSMGLDQPVHIQYTRYLKNVFIDFDFGLSYTKKAPVKDLILEAVPNTIQLSLLALGIQIFLGIMIGIFSAAKQSTWIDGTARVGSLFFYSMPSFYLALVFIFIFAGGVFYIFPSSGMVNPVTYESMSFGEKIWDRIVHIFLPAITLGIGGAAGMSRYMRGELLEVIRQDYIRTARAKGLTETAVLFKHAVKNAIIPIITLIGLSLPVLFSGSVIIESVFAWPGMGRLAVEAAFQRDYPMFLAINLIFGTVVIMGSLIADILYAVADPKVRLS